MRRTGRISRAWQGIRGTFRRRSVVAAVGVCAVVAIGLGVARCKGSEDAQAFRLRTAIPSAGDGFALALHQSLGVELRPGHEVRVVGNGAVFDSIAEDIKRARSSVYVDVFIWQKGKASETLLSALDLRDKGVDCKVLVDDAGSPGFDDDIAPRLAKAGCETRIFRPKIGTPDELARNHRKIVVVDGRIAYAGGFGIRDEWLGDGVTGEGWRDENVRFAGPSVTQAQQAIAENWQEAGGALFPAAAFPKNEPIAEGLPLAAFVASTASPVLSRAERLVQLVIQSSRKRLWIANAYFVPPKSVLDLLKQKAETGVDVRLLVPGKKSDSRISMGSQHMEYGSLVKHGVKTFEYQPSMMHAKTFVVDDEVSVIGSINLEPLSFNKLEEDALVVHDRAFNEQMSRRFEQDCTHAKPVAD